MVSFVILGEPASKANSRKIVKFGNRLASIKSDKARSYAAVFDMQLSSEVRVMYAKPVRVSLRMYYASERPDMDESLVLDLMQAQGSGTGKRRVFTRRGVYLNDRQVRERHVFFAVDRENPRVEVEVVEL